MTDANTDAGKKSMDEIMSLCKRRGFVYPASEIYGGINGFWDYGPLGAQLKKNLRDAWWHDVVMMGCRGKTGPDGNPVRVVPVDTCIIQNPKVWEASGHVAGFNDPMVQCTAEGCRKLFRADHLWQVALIRESDTDSYLRWKQQTSGMRQALISLTWHQHALSPEEQKTLREVQSDHDVEHQPVIFLKTVVAGNAAEASEALELTSKERKTLRVAPDEYAIWPMYHPPDPEQEMQFDGPCPNCGAPHSLTEPRAFNLMFPTIVGATGDWEHDKAYLRPETAQGIFIHFKNVVDTTRVRLPFGIAQTGKSFRNEVTPRNFTFRSREFEQMEIEFFCPPDQAQDWYRFWRDERMSWWQSLGLAGDNLILREHEQDELSHYSSGTSDIEYRFPFTFPGFGELEGVANRGCYDLTQHQEHSKVKLDYFDQEKNERYMPHVIEPSAGLDRGVLALLCEAYTPDPDRPSKVYMKFHPRIAPIKAAIFPLVNKDGMPEKALEIYQAVVARVGAYGFVEYDPKQNIGKRYARMDEAGCPFCFTIDSDTLTDGTVTVRDRDTLTQERIPASDVPGYLAQRLGLT
ncbi:MAG: glycine--tRNA ligase [Phycisphaerales bacterium]